MRGLTVSRLHLFYLGSEGLDAWLWSAGALGGTLSYRASFAPGRAGVDAFIDYLEPYGATPAYILADLVEEDFQRLLLPHVRGKAGRSLLARRLQQQYRETPYRRATIQGRAEEGRRDDIVLLSALTNPALLQPWMEAMELLKAPLGGLYSASMLGAALVRKLDLPYDHVLLVTRQSAGIRQSYFLDGQLKFSRLTPSVDRDGDAVNVAVEVARTQQFLTSSRLLERGVPLNAVLVAPDAELALLAQQCKDGPETAYHLVPMTVAAGQAGMDQAPLLADSLLLHLLGGSRPASHYPLGAEGRYYRFWRARVSLYASSLVLAASALAWVGANLWGYAQASSGAAQLSQETSRYDAQYRAAMAPMPPTLAPTADMKAAVTVDRLLAAQAPRPLELLSILSMALERTPQVQIVSLDWHVGESAPGGASTVPGLPADPAIFGPGADGAPVTTPIPSRLLGIPERAVQTLRVEAEVRPAHNGYRDVVNSMNQLAQDLARTPKLSVAIERPALDVRPEAKLSGKADMNEPGKPHQFVLNLVQRP